MLHVYLCLETMKLALMKSIFEAKPFEMRVEISTFPALIAGFVTGSLKFYESAPKDDRPTVLFITLLYCGALLLFITIVGATQMWGRWSEIATSILAIAVAITGTFTHLFVYLRLTSTTLLQLFSGENRHNLKFMEQWIALWTVSCIFLYYGYLYDASGTYQPAWTWWLP